MSKSLKRVRAALADAGWAEDIVETAQARTALDAANAVGCEVDQIGKSIVFADPGGLAVLFLTAGGNMVDPEAASKLAGGTLSKADAALIRAQTGFAIGGVSPVGHLNPIRVWMDRRLLEFEKIWCAAGTPHHVFACAPADLAQWIGAEVSDFTS